MYLSWQAISVLKCSAPLDESWQLKSHFSRSIGSCERKEKGKGKKKKTLATDLWLLGNTQFAACMKEKLDAVSPTSPPHVHSCYASAGPFTMKAKLMPVFKNSAFGRTHGLFALSEWQQLLFPQSWLTEHFWNTDCQDCWHIGYVEWKRAFKKEKCRLQQ